MLLEGILERKSNVAEKPPRLRDGASIERISQIPEVSVETRAREVDEDFGHARNPHVNF